MIPFQGSDPKQFITEFYTGFNDELQNSDDDPGSIVDRYHTTDIVQYADGHRLDRAKLLAHTRPVRKNRPGGRFEVHEAHATGDNLAARYTLHVENRKRNLTIEVYFFGRFTPEGRMRHANMLTRTVTTDAESPSETEVSPQVAQEVSA